MEFLDQQRALHKLTECGEQFRDIPLHEKEELIAMINIGRVKPKNIHYPSSSFSANTSRDAIKLYRKRHIIPGERWESFIRLMDNLISDKIIDFTMEEYDKLTSHGWTEGQRPRLVRLGHRQVMSHFLTKGFPFINVIKEKNLLRWRPYDFSIETPFKAVMSFEEFFNEIEIYDSNRHKTIRMARQADEDDYEYGLQLNANT